MRVLLRIAFNNLVQARRRSLMLSLAIAIVTALMVLLSSLGQGLSATLLEAATTFAAGHVNVSGFYKPTTTQAAPIIADATAVREQVLRHSAGVDYVVERIRGFGKVVSDSGTLSGVFQGVDFAREKNFLALLRLAPEASYLPGGRPAVAGSVADLTRPNTVLLFTSQAQRLGVTVGDTLTLSAQQRWGGQFNAVDVTVAAVAHDIGVVSSFMVVMGDATLRRVLDLAPATTGVVMLYLDDPDTARPLAQRLRTELTAAGHDLFDPEPNPTLLRYRTIRGEDWTGQKLDVTTWQDEISLFSWVVTAFDSLSLMLLTLLTVLICVGIMNTMWTSVRERTREIGTLRAMGMSRADVGAMFVLEAALLGLMATAAGSALGSAAALALDAAAIEIPSDAARMLLMSESLVLVLVPRTIALAIGVFTAVTSLAALWPAYRASRLPPVTAIQHITG